MNKHIIKLIIVFLLSNSHLWSQVVTTLAGTGTSGSLDSTGSFASFFYPAAVCSDAMGNIFVADYSNRKIRKITPTGVVTTFAGSGVSGSTNGIGTAASFVSPSGICIDTSGNLYVADQYGNTIRKITSSGVVSTFAGTGSQGSADGTGISASFNLPYSVASDISGNIYVADAYNHKIRKITPAGVVTTIAGSGTAGGSDGTGTAASFSTPYALTVDGAGNIYVADYYNSKIRKITPAGVVTSLAGSGGTGSTDGTGSAASFWGPNGIVVSASGDLYVSEAVNHRIRKVTSAGVVTTFAGSSAGNLNGNGTAAKFYNPVGLCLDPSGNLYAADYGNHSIRKVTIPCISPIVSVNGTPSIIVGASVGVSTFAGSGSAGNTNGTGVAASFKKPNQLAIDATGNIYVAEEAGHIIRKITPSGVVSTLAGSGSPGNTNGTGTAASFNIPLGVAVDASGNVFVADRGNNLVRKITPSGVVTTLAGSGSQGSADGTGTSASFFWPSSIAVDGSGNLFITDQLNNKIRKITQAGVVTTFAGSGTQGSADGTGTAASFSTPTGLAIDASDNIYVADYFSYKVRKITPSGVVTTLAGSSSPGSADGTGSAASFNRPFGITVDASGNVYLADLINCKIRKITSAGIVTTISGTGSIGSTNGSLASSSFYYPTGVTADNSGNLFVADNYNHKIRKIILNPEADEIKVCAGTNVTLTAGGASTYSWSGPQSITNGTSFIASTSGNYTVTATNTSGCSSTKNVKITINSSPTITLNTTPLSFSGSSSGVDTILVCFGSSVTLTAGGASTYSWSGPQSITNGTSFIASTSGNYTVTATNMEGCKAYKTIHVKKMPALNSSISVNVCNSYLTPSGKIKNVSAIFNDTIQNVFGCDSIIMINLKINNKTTSTITSDLCKQYKSPSGKEYTSIGTYIDTILNASGCDSIITITLIPQRIVINTTKNISICAGQSYFFKGTNLTSSGVYIDTVKTTNDCDSILVLNLKVIQPSIKNFSASICKGQSYLFKAIPRTQTGIYRDTLINFLGCDSFVILSLSVHNSDTTVINYSLCQGSSYNFKKMNLFKSGTYIDTLKNIFGCDSIVVLNLNLLPSKTIDIVKSNDILIATLGYNSYQWKKNNEIIPGEINYFYKVISTGTFTVQATDSNKCSLESANFGYINNGTSSVVYNLINESDLTLFPNPTKSCINIKMDLLSEKKCNLRIYSIEGKLMYSSNIPVLTKTLSISTEHFSSGIYILKLENNNTVIEKKFVVEK